MISALCDGKRKNRALRDEWLDLSCAVSVRNEVQALRSDSVQNQGNFMKGHDGVWYFSENWNQLIAGALLEPLSCRECVPKEERAAIYEGI